ncbi:MAG: hypothetical protein WAO08_30465 [Hyphomicrobiaceae bacterium]
MAEIIPQSSTTEHAASPLAQKIRALIPEVQAAVLAMSDADAKAIKMGLETKQLPEYNAARAH